MNLIAAVTSDWGIGNGNKLLVSIPEDMKFFRETTSGKVVIMGRKTLESFPGKKPLKNRVNIVVTRDRKYKAEGAVVVNKIEEAMGAAFNYKDEDVFVIGGASIYEQLLPYVDVAYVTKIDAVVPADAFFPNLDENEEWEMADVSEEKQSGEYTFRFCIYKRKK